MALRCVGSVRWGALVGVLGILVSVVTVTNAEARGHGKHRSHSARRAHAAKSGGYAPPFSAMVVDANTGRTMYAVDEDEPRHPASITKVMTLYLLFEQLERGTISLDSEFDVSARAAAQAPSKLGLRPGSTIAVGDAIKAIVTKSANDVAVVIAENVGGSEPEFAERMTRKARQLGMSGTVYKNASGLPNKEQITTAHDLTILARAIQDKFPRYYKYFQTRVFYFAGQPIANHNRLLGKVEGVDGIKTGFTNASGFNLMTSARMDGRHVVGVVLGGRSAASRDATMAGLIRTNLAKASVGRTTKVAEVGDEAVPSVLSRSRDEDEAQVASDEDDVKAPARVTRPVELIRPAVASAANASATTTPGSGKSPVPLPPASTVVASLNPEAPRASAVAGGKFDARLPTGPMVAVPASPPERPLRVEATKTEPTRAEQARAEAASRVETTASLKVEIAPPKREAAAKPASVTPWVIQLAAEQDERQARAILDDAKSKSGRILSKAQPFTEKVVRSGSTLYRARFSGFSEADDAEDACRSLKRSGFACFAARS